MMTAAAASHSGSSIGSGWTRARRNPRSPAADRTDARSSGPPLDGAHGDGTVLAAQFNGCGWTQLEAPSGGHRGQQILRSHHPGVQRFGRTHQARAGVHRVATVIDGALDGTHLRGDHFAAVDAGTEPRYHAIAAVVVGGSA